MGKGLNIPCEICYSTYKVYKSKRTGQFLCGKHRNQINKYGRIIRTRKDPNEILVNNNYAEIVLYNNASEEIARALIDIEDVEKCKNYKWWISTRDYVIAHTDNTIIRLHRLIMDVPDYLVVDHIDRNPLNNRKHNLRICTQGDNKCNNSIQSNNSTGTTGVYWYKPYSKWKAQIKINKKDIFLGYYDNKEDAIKARLEAECYYFGEYMPEENKARIM